ncbi:hypothetical protein L584_20975 [Pantoea agglomerans Tx10]|nr:hypothetical protein L584_20975 [Pantoea agglomerans Tx10]KDA93108.1 hypothetical protein T296_18350 [Pantoea agglomerans Eh318]
MLRAMTRARQSMAMKMIAPPLRSDPETVQVMSKQFKETLNVH